MEIEKNVSLAPLTTFKVGGRARFVITIKNSRELPEALRFARLKNLPIFTLGGGSNILVSDEPHEAVFLKIIEKGIKYEDLSGVDMAQGGDGGCVLLVASAGEVWDDVVNDSVSRGFGGIENLSAIPGLAGAAPIQNIGAYGRELSDVIEWVEV